MAKKKKKEISAEKIKEAIEKAQSEGGIHLGDQIEIDEEGNVTVKKQEPLTPKEIAEGEEYMTWLINFMIISRRFVHQILGILRKTPTLSVPTMGVTVRGTDLHLVYNPRFLKSMSDAEATYVLYHEVLHLVLHHCTSRNFGHTQLGNVAHDLAVNELIPVEEHCQPPRVDGKLIGCHVAELKKLDRYKDIEERQTAEWYFDYLQEKAKKCPKCGGSGKVPGDGKKGEGQTDQPCPDCGHGQLLDDHGGWGEHELADEKVRAKVDEIDKQDAWGFGTEHLYLKESIKAAQVKKVNWRDLIRMFIGNVLWKLRESTRKRPNRRTGYIFPGSKRLHVDKLLVAVDTSGSVDSLLLAEFLGTVNDMIDQFPIDLLQFDHETCGEPEPFDQKKVSFEFSGRGGTCFQPVIDACDAGGYKGLVICTDGEAAECTKPKRADVVWALPKNHEPPVKWGKRVILQRHA